MQEETESIRVENATLRD